MQKGFFGLAILLIILNVNIVFAYSDTDGHWAKKSIERLSVNGVITGYGDGTFRPDKNMTRAELITVINRFLGNSIQTTRYVPDISAKNWYYTEVRKGIESGFVTGDNSGNIKPNKPVTREEAICMLQRAIVPLNDYQIVLDFDDADNISDWAKGSFSVFYEKKYIKGYSDNTIRPKENITRAEVVTLINNLVNVYAQYGEYKGEINGNVLVNSNNVVLKDLRIRGNLIITEGGANVTLENVIVEKNLILRREIKEPVGNFEVFGKTYEIEAKSENDDSKYSNEEYGITFSIPDGYTVINVKDKDTKIDYKTKNLILVTITHDEKLYYSSFAQEAHKVLYRYSDIFEQIKEGYIGYYRYCICGSKTSNNYYIFLKRNNVEYIIDFYNIKNINILDSVASSIVLYEGTSMENHQMKTYKNLDLSLKFDYIDYVSVDDSYNTGIVNEKEALYKMFIQVTNIIDMSDYTIEQLKEILVSMEDTDGEIIDSKIKKVYIYDAVEYTIENDGKYTKSLYIVIGTKLYHFIFTSDAEKMRSAGEELYSDIINGIEFY